MDAMLSSQKAKALYISISSNSLISQAKQSTRSVTAGVCSQREPPCYLPFFHIIVCPELEQLVQLPKSVSIEMSSFLKLLLMRLDNQMSPPLFSVFPGVEIPFTGMTTTDSVGQ
jgi:hypothetical protein